MRQPLSRIEREYVVGEISRERPSFELARDGNASVSRVSEYSLDGDVVSFRPREIPAGGKFVARVSFSHKKRHMYFSSEVRVSRGTASFRIASDIMADDDDSVEVGDRLVVALSGVSCS